MRSYPLCSANGVPLTVKALPQDNAEWRKGSYEKRKVAPIQRIDAGAAFSQ